jgi:pectin methylesterase-like acyl-CoA thioesterase
MLVDADGAYDEPFFPGIPAHGKHWPWKDGKVITVDKAGLADYTTISAAITDASDGDVILVAPGFYPEELVVDRDVAIVGLVPPTYDCDAVTPSCVVLNPTLTVASARAVQVTSAAALVVFQNLRLRHTHQVTASQSTYAVYMLVGSGKTLFDHCIIAPEISATAGAATFCYGAFTAASAKPDFYDCELAIDDPLNIITSGDGDPLTVAGTGVVARLFNTRVKSGQNWSGDVNILTNGTLEMVSSIIEGTLKDNGTGGNVYVDTASRINAVNPTYFLDNDTQTKLVQRSYGLADTGGQKDLYKLNLRNLAGDVGSPGDGDLWYSTVNHKYRVRENTVIKNLRSVVDRYVTVDAAGGADYTTIQAAINATTGPAVIIIAPGIYAETLTLKANVDLIGWSCNSHVGSGTGYNYPGVEVIVNATSDTTLVTGSSGKCFCANIGFRLTTSTDALTLKTYLQGTGETTFQNCRIQLSKDAGGAVGTGSLRGLDLTPSGYTGLVHSSVSVVDNSTTKVTDACTALVAQAAANLELTDCVINGSFGVSSTKGALHITSGTITVRNSRILQVGASSFSPIHRIGGTVILVGTIASNITPPTNDPDDGTAGFTKTSGYPYILSNGSLRAYKLACRSIVGDVSTPTNGDIWYNSSTNKLRGQINSATVTIRTSTERFEIGVHNPGAAIVTGAKGRKTLSFSGTIIGWRVVSDQSTTTTLDVWKANGSIPTNANSITGTGKPSLSAAQLNSGNVSLWGTTTVVAGDVIILEVEANNNATYLALELEILVDG